MHTAQTHEEYDALAVSQWKFYVLPRRILQKLGYSSIRLPTLERHAGQAVQYSGLAEAIRTTV
ncbi:hypothetical protein [Brevibacterium otitidis]|uniref:Uncharacterized protein n=1 Tax=Brevibacterium otitidis TaxID=53364 RepID=A0ABV5X1B9_9MICO